MNPPTAEPNLRIVEPQTRNSKLDLSAVALAKAETRNNFVLTPTAKKIHTACDLARESHTVVFVWGPSHIGKTWAVEHYCGARQKSEARGEKPNLRSPISDLRSPISDLRSPISDLRSPIYARMPAA